MRVRKDSLATYHERRNLKDSPEPAGGKQLGHKKPIFVIQKHKSRRLHYDLRLEIDGVLTSWAVPKGPSTNPQDKRLAVLTEDHPLEYATFEGVIPEGNYGAGAVMVWDAGTYRNIKQEDGKTVPMSTCLKDGTIEFFLEGKKLKGAYVLIHMHGTEKDWLLIKMHDEFINKPKNPVATKTKSALTGRTMTEIEHSAKAQS